MNSQESSVDKANAFSKALESLKSQDLAFREGQLLRMLIVDKLPNNKMILFFNGDTFFAESNLALEKGQTILAKVKSTTPHTVLSLIPDTVKDAQASSDSAVINRLKLMNILPKPETVDAAKAFISENMTLKEKEFLSFMESLGKLNISSPEDLQIAAKMNRLSVPLTEEMFVKIKSFLSTDVPKVSPEEFPQKIKEMLNQMPDPLKSSLQKLVNTLETGVKGMTVEDLSVPEATLTQMEKTLAFNGVSFEKILMSRLYEKMFDPAYFSRHADFFQQEVNKLEALVQNMEGKNIISDPQMKTLMQAIHDFSKLTQSLEQGIKNIPEITSSVSNSNIQEAGFLSSLISSSSRIMMKWTESFDQLLAVFEKTFSESPSGSLDLQNLKKEAGNVLKELYNRLEETFTPKKEGADPVILTGRTEDNIGGVIKDLSPGFQKTSPENMLSGALKSIYHRDASLNIPPNYKDVLHTLNSVLSDSSTREAVSEDFRQEEGAAAKTVQNFEAETRQMTNQIYKEQFAMLSDDQASKSGYFQLLLKEPDGQTKPVKFYFKENSPGNEQGGKGSADKKSYFIFFSMELSRIGYFEVNILDLNKKLDITFFSDNPDVRNSFEAQSGELMSKLEENETISVSLKTSRPQKKKQDQIVLDFKPSSGKSGSVDIFI